jgi:hypothetical protein
MHPAKRGGKEPGNPAEPGEMRTVMTVGETEQGSVASGNAAHRKDAEADSA